MGRTLVRLSMVVLGGMLGTQALAQVLSALPRLGLPRDSVTVSGISSGAYMASQFGIAYSGTVAGVGMVAGGPYGCSRGSVGTAMFDCSCPAEMPAMFRTTLFAGMSCRTLGAQQYLAFAEGEVSVNKRKIDPVDNLRRQRVWLYRGDGDPVVNAELTKAAQALYERLGVPTAQIAPVHLPGAGHAFPTPRSQDDCTLTRFPFMVKCQVDAPSGKRDFDAAGSLLQWLYPTLDAQQPADAQPTALRQFNQKRYAPSGADFHGLDDTAWVYVPRACEQDASKCRLHVAFHGCDQGQSFSYQGQQMGSRFVQNAGYNEWAEAAGVVVLYPQVKPNDAVAEFPYKYNPKGCWDFWGYTEKYGALNRNFSKRNAPQMRAVKAMIDELTRAR